MALEITLHPKAEKRLREHLSEWLDIPPNEVGSTMLQALVNNMITDEADICNLAEEYYPE